MDILIGVIASLVATIIWVIFTQLYDFNSRKNIDFLLALLYDCADNFDSAIEASNNDIAEMQADKIIQYCKEIFESIKFFTYGRKKKKLIYTLLYNLYYTVTYYKRLWIGYDGEQEKEAKLQKFKHKYYYKVNIYEKNDDYVDRRSFLLVSVCVLQELNRNISVKESLLNNMYIGSFNTNIKQTYLELISYQNYKTKYTHKYSIQKNCFTKEEYIEYISNKLKSEGNANEQ